MKLEFVVKNYRISERLNEILAAKLNKLDKYFDTKDVPCKVVLTDLGRQCKMEVSINYHGANVRCEVIGNTMYYNIDECLPKLERQIVKHREKLCSKHKMPAHEGYEYISYVEDEKPEIAKVKKFAIESMTPEEAAEELDMVGHDFYLFVNSKTNNTEAVYRRKDGTVGLLSPYVQ